MESSVVAAVIERDGKYLLCQRPQGKRYGGLWAFLGGKVLAGESFLTARLRLWVLPNPGYLVIEEWVATTRKAR